MYILVSIAAERQTVRQVASSNLVWGTLIWFLYLDRPFLAILPVFRKGAKIYPCIPILIVGNVYGADIVHRYSAPCITSGRSIGQTLS